MFATREWMRAALLCNLVGAALLFYSFQATSSNVKIITAPHEGTALCAYGNSIFDIFPTKKWIIGGPCPDWKDARPAAIVNLDEPWLASIGLLLLLGGFLLQLLAIPGPKTTAQLRADLKRVQAEEKARRQKTKVKP